MQKILFIGCGKLGTAFLFGMFASKKFQKEQISIILPSNSTDQTELNRTFPEIRIINEYPKDEVFNAIIFAVKPQIMNTVGEYYAKAIPNSSRTLVISPVTGKKIAFYKKFFPNHPVIRIMPNINAQVGRSITGIYSNDKLENSELELIENIISSLGKLVWLKNEDDIDAITAISGSGPAYFFLFAEHLMKAAIELGFNEHDARLLAEETFIGASETLSKTQKKLHELRESVTSPNGTTYAALTAFNKNDRLESLVKEAVMSAKTRAKELAE